MGSIGKNSLCPCGSGRKYKKCCLGRHDDPFYTEANNFDEIFKIVRKSSAIKHCLYPSKEECKGVIVKAHSIQNNKIINKLATNGIVYMPCPKISDPYAPITRYGRKEASVFTGFCELHDKKVFQPIEDYDFKKTKEQIFLYTYRCLAVEFHKKLEVVNMERSLLNKRPSLIHDFERRSGFLGYHAAILDLEHVKNIFDAAILDSDFDILSSVIWEFDGVFKFAGSGFGAITHDLLGNSLQNLLDFNVLTKHIFLIVFPEGTKTYCIISWLKENDCFFNNFKEQLLFLSYQGRKNFINVMLPNISENIIINPEAWESWDEEKKNTFLGVSSFFNTDNYSFWDINEWNDYDLFDL